MLTVVETPVFQRLATDVVYTKAKLDDVRPEFLLKLKEQLDV